MNFKDHKFVDDASASYWIYFTHVDAVGNTYELCSPGAGSF